MRTNAQRLATPILDEAITAPIPSDPVQQAAIETVIRSVASRQQMSRQIIMKINPDEFTENALRTIIDAKDLALSKYHQNIETEHLFYSLLTIHYFIFTFQVRKKVIISQYIL